jgi:hypothetical protein
MNEVATLFLRQIVEFQTWSYYVFEDVELDQSKKRSGLPPEWCETCCHSLPILQ